MDSNAEKAEKRLAGDFVESRVPVATPAPAIGAASFCRPSPFRSTGRALMALTCSHIVMEAVAYGLDFGVLVHLSTHREASIGPCGNVMILTKIDIALLRELSTQHQHLSACLASLALWPWDLRDILSIRRRRPVPRIFFLRRGSKQVSSCKRGRGRCRLTACGGWRLRTRTCTAS